MQEVCFKEGEHITDIKNRRYTEAHCWAGESGGLVYTGITDYAQETLKDVVFVDVPAPGSGMVKDTAYCSIESIKTVSDVIAPLTGKIVLINEELDTDPAKLNADPLGCWIAAVEPADAGWAEGLSEKPFT